MNIQKIIEILKDIDLSMNTNKLYLSELDTAIGDGDHGHNMTNGFNKVYEDLENNDYSDIGELFKKVGMILVSNIGGASGPLYGTAFMQAGTSMMSKENVDINDFAIILENSVKGIKLRGHAELGDKTIIDVLEPAYESVKTGIEKNDDYQDILRNMIAVSEKQLEYTKTIAAKKGRASYLGERSIGHQDPGATSCYIILKTITDAVFY